MESLSMQEKWAQISKDVADPDLTTLSDKGTLVVVGSGIMCVSHFTIETQGQIKEADKVFYLVADAVTEVFIQELRPDAVDLFVLYGENKDRHVTYAQISEVLLHYTRRGHKVVAVFYGHPGYLVNPSRKAVKIAKSEGLSACELPGISSLDTLISELGFEPGIPGFQVFEATDLLMYSRKIMTDFHVVINQVGCVGDVTFHYNGFPNPHFPVLIEYLIQSYGENHVVYNYIGACFPVCKSLVESFELVDLLKPENAKNIDTMSTMYLPPLTVGKLNDELAGKIGMIKEVKQDGQHSLVSTNENETTKETDTKFEKVEMQDGSDKLFSEWSIPDNYKPVKQSPLARLLIDLSKSSQSDSEQQAKKYHTTLPEYQAKALETKNSDWISFALRNNEVDIKTAMEANPNSRGTTKNVHIEESLVTLVDGKLKAARPFSNAPRSAKPLVDVTDAAPRSAKPLVDVTDAAIRSAKPLVDVTDAAPKSAKPLVDVTDAAPKSAKPLVDVTDAAPRSAKPLVDVTDAAPKSAKPSAASTVTCDHVDGAPKTAQPLISAAHPL